MKASWAKRTVKCPRRAARLQSRPWRVLYLALQVWSNELASMNCCHGGRVAEGYRLFRRYMPPVAGKGSAVVSDRHWPHQALAAGSTIMEMRISVDGLLWCIVIGWRCLEARDRGERPFSSLGAGVWTSDFMLPISTSISNVIVDNRAAVRWVLVLETEVEYLSCEDQTRPVWLAQNCSVKVVSERPKGSLIALGDNQVGGNWLSQLSAVSRDQRHAWHYDLRIEAPVKYHLLGNEMARPSPTVLWHNRFWGFSSFAVKTELDKLDFAWHIVFLSV